MKIIKFIMILSLLLNFTTAFSQKAPDTVVINFLDLNNIPKYTKVKYKEKYVIKVENINKSLFKVDDSYEQEDFNSEMPEIFKGIKIPAYFNLSLPTTSLDNALIEAGSAPVGSTSSDYKSQINNNLLTVSNAFRSIYTSNNLNNNLKNIYSSCNTSYAVIESELILVVNQYLGTSTTSRSTQVVDLRNHLDSAITDAMTAKSNIDFLVPLHLQAINNLIKLNIDNIITTWEKEPLDKKNPNYLRGLFIYKTAKNDNETLNNYKDSLTTVLTKGNELITFIKTFNDENKVQDLINNYNLINYSNFTYKSKIIEITGDELKYKFDILSEKQLPCNIQNKTNISETYKVNGGVKVDFSSGIFTNFGNEDFLGRKLFYQNDGDKVIIRSKNGGDRALLSLGALMHIYFRNTCKINLALSPGLSTTTAFDGLNFHLGISGILGRKNRLVISLGLVCKESEILDKNYNLNQQYAKDGLPESPPTIKVFPKFGSFIGLTYNWSKLKSQSE